MKSARRITVFAAAVTTVSAALVAVSSAAVAQPTDQVSTDAAGRVIAVEPANPLAAPEGAKDPVSAAKAHAGRLSQQFNVKVGDLVVGQAQAVPGGSVVRLQQNIDGVPVFGAQVVQDLDQNGGLVTAVGKTSERRAGSFPADRTAAQNQAKNAAAAAVHANGVRITGVQAYWYDASLGGGDAKASAVPTFFVQLKAAEDKWTVIVGANDGKVLAVWSETKNAAPNRVVCDANRKIIDLDIATEKDVRCGGEGVAFTSTRSEGRPDSGIKDVDQIYSFFGTAQGFYGKYTGFDLTGTIGADYGDGKGKALRGTVRMCATFLNQQGTKITQCPWENAFWDGEQMAFGEGLDTLDVTGHELTHGVTQHTSGLNGGYAAALNEGMSDVFGMFMAFKAHDPNNSGPNRWQLGVGTSIGQVRDMKNPANTKHPGPGPDRVDGEHWQVLDADGNLPDEHVNALVLDKTAYLITDGDRFNGQNIRGIGEDKAIALWWKVENLLRPTSTFRDLGIALNKACASNVRAHVAYTNPGDCVQVARAVIATQLLQAP